MKNLVLYGASRFGDEIVQLVRDINFKKHEWNIVGFLDDNQSIINTIRNGIPVLGDKRWVDSTKTSELYYICCIGKPKDRERVISYLAEQRVRFATLIHPSVIISNTVYIGEGSIITAGNILTTNIEIGRHVIINLGCTIGHRTIIEDFVTINPGANISGNVKIEKGCYIGTNAAVLENITIGTYTIVGAGAVVVRDLPCQVTAVGVPAKVIKTNSEI